METIRLGIVGLGNIGHFHASYVLAGVVSRCELAAVCSRKASFPPEFKSVPIFDDVAQMIRSGKVNAVLLATPHRQHPIEGIAAFESGLHVLTEKPIASHKADAELFVAAHQKSPGCVFAVMSQFRAEPRYQKMRELIRTGALGELARVSWINTDWFRPDAYYASSEWRATWRSEGGGVLINQCLHNLDMLQWLVGMPVNVRGFCKFGRFHDIEVEDDVTAYLEWPGGMTGTFVSSTGEAPGTNRLEIAGTLGRLLLENGKLFFTVNEMDAREKSRTADQPFAHVAATTQEILFHDATRPHAMLLQNFVNAIIDGETLLSPGAEGINALEIANATVHSSLLDKPVNLPLDGVAWKAKLTELEATSPARKRVIRNVVGDVASSFKR